MFGPRQVVVLPIICAVVSALSWGTGGKSHDRPTNVSDKTQKELLPATARQEQSVLPLSPEGIAPRSLKVSYVDGQLTIIAENSTLADILSAVRSQTGAVVDLPPGSGSERVVSRVGPGPARDVLSALLNGSRFDYVIVGSRSNPAGVERIILMPRSNESGNTDHPGGNFAVYQTGQQPSQRNVTGTGLAQQPPSGQDATEADADAGDDDSEQPTVDVISEAEDPPEGDGQQQAQPGQPGYPGQMPQLLPQQLGPNPQQPSNQPTTPEGLPQPPHN